MSLPRRARFATATVVFAAALAGAAAANGNARGLDARNLDPNAGACRDFFAYANGGWLKANPIPAAYSHWSLDDELAERNEALLKQVLDATAAGTAEPGSDARKLGDFWAAALDEAGIERAGLDPLQPDLEAIAALKTPDDLATLIRAWQVRGDDVLFDVATQPDLKDSTSAIVYAGQGGLGLPDRDYYLRNDGKSQRLRAEYRRYVADLLKLAGDADAQRDAAAVLALETRLAQASLDPTALRDPASSYHVMTPAAADAKTPRLDWRAFFAAAGRGDLAQFSLAQPDFFVAADRALAEVPLRDWQAYLSWRLLDANAPYLPTRFVDTQFAFRGRILRGARQNRPRWKRALDSADSAIGELVGEAYVARAFPPQAKQRAMELVANLKTALRARIAGLAWMSEPTRQHAYAKLDTLVAKIGYPDHWRDYSALRVARDSYLGNMRAAAAFERARQFAKAGRPIDRSEWDMTPQTINAYYNPMGNEIVFPAAQLLPPYFDADANDALNYGSIGTVIGHELTHGFDDEGSRFDAHGNLVEWWTPADRAEFERRTARLAAQFGRYVAVDDLHIDGKLTLGENIADLGGLLVAYDAFKLTPQGNGGAPIDGLSPEQRFFLAFAQTWRTAERPEQLRLQVRSDEHAPAKFRVIGPLSDMPAFAQAFACKPGDPMRASPENLVEIW